MKTSDEERFAALEAEIAALRKAQEPPEPKVEPRYRTLPGQGSVPVNSAGERLLAAPDPTAATVGGNVGFGSAPKFKVLGDGRRVPVDVMGVPRDPRTGEILPLGQVAPAPLPQRSAMHQEQVDLVDRLYQAQPMRRDDDDIPVDPVIGGPIGGNPGFGPLAKPPPER